MSDDVKFIFKTLIKVPIIIFELYLVFNLFCFMFIYFKTLGIQYVAMQTVVENNYIPTDEMDELNEYLDDLEAITFVLPQDQKGNKTEIIVRDDETGEINQRTQYGQTKEVGVRVVYEFQLPLMPHEQKASGVAVDGLNGAGSSGDWDTSKQGHTKGIAIPIKITYKVPGLQYYPDLDI